jgi:peptide/nickel transport system permease protein
VTRFLIRRVLQGLFVMWLMTVTVFLIFFVGPGPGFAARVLAGRNATAIQVAAVSHRLLLDRPIYVQYGHFIWLLLHGNLGYDYYHSQSVNTVLKSAFPITLSLVIGAASCGWRWGWPAASCRRSRPVRCGTARSPRWR